MSSAGTKARRLLVTALTEGETIGTLFSAFTFLMEPSTAAATTTCPEDSCKTRSSFDTGEPWTSICLAFCFFMLPTRLLTGALLTVAFAIFNESTEGDVTARSGLLMFFTSFAIFSVAAFFLIVVLLIDWVAFLPNSFMINSPRSIKTTAAAASRIQGSHTTLFSGFLYNISLFGKTILGSG